MKIHNTHREIQKSIPFNWSILIPKDIGHEESKRHNFLYRKITQVQKKRSLEKNKGK